jgi:hypothetical protein
MVLKRRCPNMKCRHIHAGGTPCHVFIVDKSKANDDDESDEETESEEEESEEEEEESEEEDEDGDDDDDEGGNMDLAAIMDMGKKASRSTAGGAKEQARKAKRAEKEALKALKRKAHQTPSWAQDLRLKRCNCTMGVPIGSKEFWPVRGGWVGGWV